MSVAETWMLQEINEDSWKGRIIACVLFPSFFLFSTSFRCVCSLFFHPNLFCCFRIFLLFRCRNFRQRFTSARIHISIGRNKCCSWFRVRESVSHSSFWPHSHSVVMFLFCSTRRCQFSQYS